MVRYAIIILSSLLPGLHSQTLVCPNGYYSYSTELQTCFGSSLSTMFKQSFQIVRMYNSGSYDYMFYGNGIVPSTQFQKVATSLYHVGDFVKGLDPNPVI